jgi:hypothetical protein
VHIQGNQLQQSFKQQSQTNIVGMGHPPYSNNRSLKNESNNFATVTANTGNMIVSNTPIVSKKDSVIAVGSTHALKQ